MQAAPDRVANIICQADLEKEQLGWCEGKFYVVRPKPHRWWNFRKVEIEPQSNPHCDYQLVTQKVREFLEEYQGSRKSQVVVQLKKLESKLADYLTSQTQQVLNFKGQAVLNDGNHSIVLSPIPVDSEGVKEITPQPNFFNMLGQLEEMTKTIESEYAETFPITRQSCRCNWIYCPKKTNVKVESYSEEDFGYIHANTVSLGKNLNFIATIYPLNRTIFWAMAMEKGNVIVDLTNGNDLARNDVNVYYPRKIGECHIFSERWKVECSNKKNLTDQLIEYGLEVSDLTTHESRRIDRIHYTGWEDVCGTREFELYDLILALEPYLGQKFVPIVHCMGGVGRTGTGLTGVAIKQAIHAGEITSLHQLDDYMRMSILEGRRQRGPEYVQTPTQLETLWKLGEYLLFT